MSPTSVNCNQLRAHSLSVHETHLSEKPCFSSTASPGGHIILLPPFISIKHVIKTLLRYFQSKILHCGYFSQLAVTFGCNYQSSKFKQDSIKEMVIHGKFFLHLLLNKQRETFHKLYSELACQLKLPVYFFNLFKTTMEWDCSVVLQSLDFFLLFFLLAKRGYFDVLCDLSHFRH